MLNNFAGISPRSNAPRALTQRFKFGVAYSKIGGSF